MDYGNLKGKKYAYEVNKIDNNYCIISFDDSHHVKISAKAKIIFDCFDGKSSLNEISEKLAKENIKITPQELKKFVDVMLLPNCMLEGSIHKKNNESLLWVKFPVVDSSIFEVLFNKTKKVFDRPTVFILLGAVLCSLLYSFFRVVDAGVDYMNLNSLAILLIVYLDMIFHEIGHVSAAYYCGIRVGKIGIGIYLFYPVMYVDMTNAWRLKRLQRMLIDVSGVFFQLFITIPLVIIGSVFNMEFLFVLNISLFFSTFINILPLTKMDGYWLFCDALELNNLSKNALKSIKGIKKISKRENGESDIYEKNRWINLIFSALYLISVIATIIAGIVYSYSILNNWQEIFDRLFDIRMNIQNCDFNQVFLEINNMFIYILPIFFIAIMILKTIVKFVIKKEN